MPQFEHYLADGLWHHNTGKSVACLHRLHFLCHHVAGLRCLILRKTRESLTESALVSFERYVVPPGHHILLAGGQRRMRQSYRYANGSEIVVGGLDKPGKVMSTEYDLAYVQEAIELSEDAWEAVTTRLRNNALPFQQLMADTNPDKPSHWLKKRVEAGRTLMLESRHEDNPLLWDATAGRWTEFGETYIAKLDDLTGPRKQRLRYGRWVQAEGVVYADWDAAIHVVKRFPIPPDWPRYWAIDFGYTDAFVCQFWAKGHDGRLYLYREIVHTKRLVEDHAKRILHVSQGEPQPRAIICDHDAEGRATLERHLRLKTTAAHKTLSTGIQAVMVRLKPAGPKQQPRLLVFDDCLDQRDPDMIERKLPIGLAQEIDGYIWDEGNGRKKGEMPVDRDNHSCLAAGTLVETMNGSVPIEQIRPDMKVLTREGFFPVKAAGMTCFDAKIFALKLSDGTTLSGTNNHPIFVYGKGFLRLDSLRYMDTIMSCKAKPLSSTESNFAGIRWRSANLTELTTRRTCTLEKMAWDGCTRRYGRRLTGRSPEVTISTTSISTRSITTCRIFSALPLRITSESTASGMCLPKGRGHILTASVLWLPGGTVPRRAWRGIGSTERNGLLIGFRLNASASDATRTMLFSESEKQISFVLASVGRTPDETLALTMSGGFALNVDEGLQSTDTLNPNAAPVHVLSVCEQGIRQPVFNLTIDGPPEFFANGILVHNCDPMRYCVAYHDLASAIGSAPPTMLGGGIGGGR